MNAIAEPIAAEAAPLVIGQAIEGGHYAGNIRVGTSIFGLIVSPKAGDLKGAWHQDRADVPEARNTFDGLANTQALAAAGSELAKQVLALDINGHTDWYLPSRDELELLYRHLKPTTALNYCTFRDGDNPSSVPPGHLYTEESPAQTTVEAFKADGADAFEPRWYVSSTQYSEGYAYNQYFDGGDQSYDDKSYEGRARAVRRFLIAA